MDRTFRARGLSDVGSFASSVVLLGLAVLGIAGFAYHALAPEGLIGPWLGRLWANHPISATLVLVGLVAVTLTARSQTGFSIGPMQRNGNGPLYLLVAFGTFFAFRWLVIGTL
jgi:hypothetical protein